MNTERPSRPIHDYLQPIMHCKYWFNTAIYQFISHVLFFSKTLAAIPRFLIGLQHPVYTNNHGMIFLSPFHIKKIRVCLIGWFWLTVCVCAGGSRDRCCDWAAKEEDVQEVQLQGRGPRCSPWYVYWWAR